MKSALRADVLRVLSDGPAFGLQILERLGVLGSNPGPNIYPELRAMELEGLLESYEVEEAMEERGGRPRRYYRIAAPSTETKP